MTRKTQPAAPGSLPKYLAEGLPKQDNETLEDVIAYAEQLIEQRQQPVDLDDLDDDVEDVEEQTESGTIVTKMVTCGDETCHCYDGEKHGPYRYRVYRDDRGKVTADYLGKV